MKKGWPTAKLGDLCDVLDSKRKPITKKDRISGEYPYYGATGILDYVEGYIFDEKLILIGEDGAKWGAGENTAFMAEGKYWVNNHAHVIRPHRNTVLDQWIIYHLNVNDLSPFITGLTVPKLNQGKLREISIPLPSLSEQKRIVATLDEAFEGIAAAVANAEKNLANSRELFETYLTATFTQKGEGWAEKTIGDVCQIKPPNKEAKQKLTDTDLVSFVPMSNLGKRQKDLTLNYEKPLKDVVGSYTYFADNDVLLAKITPCFENGKLGIARNLTNGIGFGSSEYIVFRSRGDIVPEYLFYFLSRNSFRNAGARVMTGAVGHKRVPKEFIENHLINIPPLSEQKRIVAILNELSSETKRLEAIYQQKLAALAELKQSILQKAFAGELISDAVATTSPEFTAQVLALAHYRHALRQKDETFGHVKAQKILQLVENIGGIDLGREPIKDAAGPNDFKHMLRAEEWARTNQFFEFVKIGERYEFKKLNRYDKMIAEARSAIKPYRKELDKVVDLLIPMNTKDAEVFTTVHTAWNELVHDGEEFDDDKIIYEARDNWHPNKMDIPKSEFQEAIRLIRKKGLVPDGKAKRLVGQERFCFE